MSRPILPWHSPQEVLPVAEVEVWVRRLPWYDKPVLAESLGSTGVQITGGYGSTSPDTWQRTQSWDLIHSWKFRLLADEQTAFPP